MASGHIIVNLKEGISAELQNEQTEFIWSETEKLPYSCGAPIYLAFLLVRDQLCFLRQTYFSSLSKNNVAVFSSELLRELLSVTSLTGLCPVQHRWWGIWWAGNCGMLFCIHASSPFICFPGKCFPSFLSSSLTADGSLLSSAFCCLEMTIERLQLLTLQSSLAFAVTWSISDLVIVIAGSSSSFRCLIFSHQRLQYNCQH